METNVEYIIVTTSSKRYLICAKSPGPVYNYSVLAETTNRSHAEFVRDALSKVQAADAISREIMNASGIAAPRTSLVAVS
jgi:hypothetical protein